MQKFIAFIIRYRKRVVAATVLVTIGFLTQLRSLQVIIDPDSVLPQTHPYIATGNVIEKIFGNKFTVVVALSPKQGDVYQDFVLEKVLKITKNFQDSPQVVKTNVMSLTARKAKNIEGAPDGMRVSPLLEKVPQTRTEWEHLKTTVTKNLMYENLLISKDLKTTQIIAEFKKTEGGFSEIQKTVASIVAPEADDKIQISVSGLPIFLALLEKYSARMAFLFPLALFIIGLIHFEAFRTVQALVLPLVTALLAVLWAMGTLGFMREPFDVFNASTPILILAIAAGHAVQILKRYYEEYAVIKKQYPQESTRNLSERAVLSSLTKVGPVMIVACTVAALGFFSLMIFDIKSIRTFGVFTGSGVIAALVLELTFIPAIRVMLPPPGQKELEREDTHSFWDRVINVFYRLVIHKRKIVYMTSVLLIALLSLGGYWLKIDNSQKEYFYGQIKAKLDDDAINSRMAGTNPFYILIQGEKEDDIKRPDVLRFMEALQKRIQIEPLIGKSLSIVDFIKKMNQSINEDKAEY